jgi:hypothetical protein
MIQGSWVRGSLGTFVIGVLTLASTEAFSGFEIGNGGFIDRFIGGRGSLSDSLEGMQIDDSGKITEIVAPPSDGASPRTRLMVHALPIVMTAEEAFNTFLTFNAGWRGFSMPAYYGIHREREVRKDWTRLEIQLFRKNEKFVISLEGNKRKSPAYTKLAESLLAEVSQ